MANTRERAISAASNYLTRHRRRIYGLIIYAVLGASSSFIGNVYFIGAAGGYNKDLSNGTILADKTFWAGATFWFALNLLLFGLVGYWRAVGSWRFSISIVMLPARIVDLFRERPVRDVAFLLLGFAVAFPFLPYPGLWTVGVLAFGLLCASLSNIPIYGARAVTGVTSFVAGGLRTGSRSSKSARSAIACFVLGAAIAHLLSFSVGLKMPAYGYSAVAGVFALVCGVKARVLGNILLLSCTTRLAVRPAKCPKSVTSSRRLRRPIFVTRPAIPST